MSNVAKGRVAEKRCEDDLKAAGYLTYRAMRGGRRFHAIDIFGCIDVMGKHPDTPDQTLWVQVTAAKTFPTAKFAEMLAVPWGAGDLVQGWQWRGRLGWAKVQVHPPLPQGGA